MKIESDRIQIVSGVRHGETLGSPISFIIENRDWQNWTTAMSSEPVAQGADLRKVTRPRPGHADLAGALKHGTDDVRDILERASARETATRVAAGSLCRLLLRRFGIRLASHVIALGGVAAGKSEAAGMEAILSLDPESPLPCLDADAAARMRARIDRAMKDGDTLGGVAEIVADGVPPGLGSHGQWDRKLDGKMAQALMSIPAVKAVEIGDGLEAAAIEGSQVHDEIFYDDEQRRFYRKTNRAGGLEGGISNGSEIRARIFVKPIPTLRKALQSVDLVGKEPSAAAFERSDTCVVPAAGVVGEAMLGYALAEAFLEKFGGDSIAETSANYESYNKSLEAF
jgi:chorismate synthase